LRPPLAQQAEPVEPVAWSGYDLDGMVEAFSRVIEAHHSSKNPFHDPINTDARMALRILRGFIPAMKAYAAPPQRKELEARAALAHQAEPAQEPVAWIHTDPDKPRVRFLEWREDEPGYRGRWVKTPLYLAPPQRKPLTEEEIDKIARARCL
jgi:hypothetical protein